MFVNESGKPFKLIGIKPIKKNDFVMTFIRLHDYDTFENYEMIVANETPVYDEKTNRFLLDVGTDVDLRLMPNLYQGKLAFKAHVTPVPTK